MKCPKCAYVGFEESDRCRHCGYDFSLMAPAGEPPLTIPAAEPIRHMSYRDPVRGLADAELGRAEAAPLRDLPLAAPALAASLFADPQPPPARTPLAVRRSPERPRNRATPHVVRRPRTALLDTPADESETPLEASAAPPAAPPVARFLALLVDVTLLAGIDAAVVYLTAQIASVPLAQVPALPLVPLVSFILGLNVAYLTVFTANGGQTLGKMATGLRVEATEGALTLSGAVVRVAAAIAGGLAAGVGFLPALFRADRRAVHDQIAHTRVVKVSA